MPQKRRTFSTRHITILAMLIAVGVALSVLTFAGAFPAASYLAYDPSGIPLYLAAFLFGPLAGSVAAIVTGLLYFVTHGSTGGLVGIFMMIMSSLFCVIPAGFIYSRNRTKRGAIIALVVSSVIMVVGNLALNLVITPIYFGVPLNEVVKLILPAFLPFNVLKALINAVATFVIYKPLSKLVHHFD